MSNTEDYNMLVLEELKGIKEELREVRQELLNNANMCGEKRHDLLSNFVSVDTFWKVLGVGSIIVSGSYAYTTLIYTVLKH